MALQGFSEAFCLDLVSSVTDQSCQVMLAGCGCPLPCPYLSGKYWLGVGDHYLCLSLALLLALGSYES